jgi:hypothetical protein
MAHVVEYLSSKCKGLNSNPSTEMGVGESRAKKLITVPLSLYQGCSSTNSSL